MKYLLTAIIFISCISTQAQIQLPYNRMIQPAGSQIYFGDEALENHALDAALSPDGKWLAVEERYSIVFISTADNKIKYVLKNSDNPDLRGGMNTYSGIVWHKGGEMPEVFWSSTGRNSKCFVASAKWTGEKAEFLNIIEFKALPPAKLSLPNEIIISKEANTEYIYVVLNGNDRVVKQELTGGKIIWESNPGVAPYGITSAAGKLYVTNWAGRTPEAGDKDIAAVPWTMARVDNAKAGGATREGSVTVINPEDGKILKEIVVGLHPNEIISDKQGKYVYITNSNSDNVTVINTSSDIITETISVRLQPEINPYFGDSPNGIALSSDEKTLYVANGMDNALAVIKLGRKASLKGSGNSSRITGFIPTGAYPSAIAVHNSGFLYVCNLEAEGVRLGLKDNNTVNLAYNSHHQMASVSVISVPEKRNLRAYTDTVIAVNDLSRATLAREKPRSDAVSKPLPERIGEPSVFKHVLYIIKENRTYDQVLGDMKQGNGDPGLCIFGAEITPNTHKLAEEFILLDNFNVSGKCSAEGHQWTDASIVNDYIEKNMRAWFRSYPHVQEDALVYSPSGFLWDNALREGKSVKIYGEASVPVFPKKTTWSDVYNAFLKGEKVEFTNHTTIDPVKPILSQTFPSYGSHEFPDVVRADVFIKELKEYEKMEGDKLPELMIMALPNDHTGGTRPGLPTPRAMVADNDLALGQIVEAVSKSRFWANTVIFVVEDDSQSGWDHVSAYRTVGLVLSPYSRMKNTNSTYYVQPSVVRTIEQILGLPPMNIQDAIANPMADCFTSVPDLTPYTSVKNNIPIDEMNPQLSSLTGRELHYAKKSMLPVFDKIDSGEDDLLNRIIWYSIKGSSPYPSKYEGNEEEEIEEISSVNVK
jgi:YVTN family beta-propeller protein